MDSMSTFIQNTIINLKYRIFDIDFILKELNLPTSKKNEVQKEFSRLERTNEIERLTNEIYFRTEVSKVTKKNKGLSDNEIIHYYTRDSTGFTIGYDLYNRKNISTQISKKQTVLSSLLKKEMTVMKSITIKKLYVNVNTKTREYIEFLEIVENSSYIQDFNERGFYKLAKNFVRNYDYELLSYILKAMNYKVETVYNIHKIVQIFGKDSGFIDFTNGENQYHHNKAYETIYIQKRD